jgi:hypothetical protein
MDGNAATVTLELGKDECLVLFELLSRTFQDDAPLEAKFEGELQALLRLHGSLEKTLVEPLDPNYENIVRTARKRLVERYGHFQTD